MADHIASIIVPSIAIVASPAAAQEAAPVPVPDFAGFSSRVDHFAVLANSFAVCRALGYYADEPGIERIGHDLIQAGVNLSMEQASAESLIASSLRAQTSIDRTNMNLLPDGVAGREEFGRYWKERCDSLGTDEFYPGLVMKRGQ